MSAPSEGSTRPRALVTGATGGIGYELAKTLAENGHDLILVARNEASLQRTADEFHNRYHVDVQTIAQDLAEPDAAAKVVLAAGGPNTRLDVLVNNAGFASYGAFIASDVQAELGIIHVNILTLTLLTKLLLPGMVRRGEGRILNVASTAAFLPGPLMAVYYASKAYVLSLSEALAEETRDTGVTVTALCPGPTETSFQQRAKMENSKLVSERRLMSANEVARVGYAGMMDGKRVVIPGLANRVVTMVPRLLPRNVIARVVRQSQEHVVDPEADEDLPGATNAHSG